MRLLHVIDRPDAVGGVQSYLRLLIPGLEARGIESEVISSTDIPGLEADGARLAPDTRAALERALDAHAPDLCLLHSPQLPGVAAAIAERVPLLAYAHDYAMVCPGNARFLHTTSRFCSEGPGLRCFWRAYTEHSTNRRPDRLLAAYRRARAWPDMWPVLARLLVASPFVASLFESEGVAGDRIRVLPYPVQPASEVAGEPAGDILFVGRLVRAKGLAVLLRAAAGLEGRSVVVAGDGPERQSLEALAVELGVDVRFLGWVDESRRAALLRGCRVFAMPSLWEEPFGIAGVEALGAGLPVVASRVGGIPSWLDDGHGGLLVEPGDVDALRSALRRVLEEPHLAATLAGGGPPAAARFSLDAHLDRLVPELEAVG